MTTLAGPAARPVDAYGATGPVTTGKPVDDNVLAGVLVTSLSIALLVCLPDLRHWFMVPTTLTGILIGAEALRWFRRDTDVFDPRACAGLLGLQFLYLAPILNVAFDEWVTGVYDQPAWRDALGALGILNAVGTGLYRVVLALPRRPRRRPRRVRAMNMPTFYLTGLALAGLSIAAMGYEIAIFGGLDGFVDTMADQANRVEDMTGLGPLIVLAEAFPYLVFTLVLVRWRKTFARHTVLLVLLVLALTVTQFFIGGLKGSRSSTLWPLLLALVLVNVTVRRVPRKVLAMVGVLVFAFIYLYAFYKLGGTKAIDEIRRAGTIQGAVSDTGRDMPMLLTADLGRADIQGVILHRYLDGQFEPVLGATYANAWFMFLPDGLFPNVPPSKVDVGSRILYNPLYPEGRGDSSKIYGMAGEGIINFGLVGGVLSFVAFGFVIRAVQGYYTAAVDAPELVPKLIAPAVWVFVTTQGSDLDNILFGLCKYSMPVILLVWLACRFGPHRRRPLPAVP
ncbi:hypothetical protein E1258_02670 [Micromonospora sp. KC207]|uniref:hypothetical protein n=1 Tax=Micromonospora sp. KC207 TaxID=2530377 RepID=UPI00104C3FF0|nr:hypothetical protein [Micromonospora sp. KC207]TDC66486.1 hypothetical protein E1258_02670 [Micromonospora sp. KC207]